MGSGTLVEKKKLSVEAFASLIALPHEHPELLRSEFYDKVYREFHFVSIIFLGSISINKKDIQMRFTDCEFKSSVNGHFTSFKSLNFHECTFQENVLLNGSTVLNSIGFWDCSFNKSLIVNCKDCKGLNINSNCEELYIEGGKYGTIDISNKQYSKPE